MAAGRTEGAGRGAVEADLQAKDLNHGLGGLQLHIAGHVDARP
jgi:hypothetical protein